ncbi:MAG: aspartate aminotransferase family protein [Chitinophagaceae bacterium]|nr:aspartate aminotransferase family protein [Chitinophagaceae bacterium]
MTERELFFRHIAQTSPSPPALEISHAAGCYIYDKSGRHYIDLIGGISVANVGHGHPEVLEALRRQSEAYLHVMVYGEFVESPQVQYAKLLTEHLPEHLNCVYFTNSGAEATEGALKLAKRYTGRSRILCFERSYHGSTHGALSLMGDEYWRNAFRPLLPDVWHLKYNDITALDEVDEYTACVVAETVQAESGILAPEKEWLKKLRKKCYETGALLILDEIQSGFGRTGKLWAFEHFDITPDILLLGKALGGGLPLGAFLSDKKIMNSLSENPVLGHITTFGGHPLCCATGMAAFLALKNHAYMEQVKQKEQLFHQYLKHPEIRKINSFGLWMAVEFDSPEKCRKIIHYCYQNGVITDWFLFRPECMRISPPLIIEEDQIRMACDRILKSLEEALSSQM